MSLTDTAMADIDSVLTMDQGLCMSHNFLMAILRGGPYWWANVLFYRLKNTLGGVEKFAFSHAASKRQSQDLHLWLSV